MYKKSIANNTMLLYLRMLIIMLINLYMVRVVLDALGAEDYGIYNVVAGVITTLSCFSTVLAASIQRFYSYSIGSADVNEFKKIYSISLNLVIALSIIVFVIGETIGLWFVNSQLNIPGNRMFAANWTFQFTVFSFIASLIATPFIAAVFANEDFKVYSLVSVSQCFLQLLVAILLKFILIDRLFFYGLSLFIIQLLSMVPYVIFCKLKYAECHYNKSIDRTLMRKILSFSVWNLFSSVAGIGLNQIVTILTNIFFGPIVNASRAVAQQVGSALNSFINGFITALKPPMIKAYAEGNLFFLYSLFMLSNKFVYYCLLIVFMPLFTNIEEIISIWLKTVNQDTIVFTKLMLVYSFILSLNNPISIIIQATGEIKKYSIYVESIMLAAVPLTYVLYKFGCSASSTYFVMIAVSVLAHFVRLYFLKKQFVIFKYSDYFLKFIFPAIAITSVVFCVTWVLNSLIDTFIIKFFLSLIISFLVVILLVFLFGFSKDESKKLRQYLNIWKNRK